MSFSLVYVTILAAADALLLNHRVTMYVHLKLGYMLQFNHLGEIRKGKCSWCIIRADCHENFDLNISLSLRDGLFLQWDGTAKFLVNKLMHVHKVKHTDSSLGLVSILCWVTYEHVCVCRVMFVIYSIQLSDRGYVVKCNWLLQPAHIQTKWSIYMYLWLLLFLLLPIFHNTPSLQQWTHQHTIAMNNLYTIFESKSTLISILSDSDSECHSKHALSLKLTTNFRANGGDREGSSTQRSTQHRQAPDEHWYGLIFMDICGVVFNPLFELVHVL